MSSIPKFEKTLAMKLDNREYASMTDKKINARPFQVLALSAGTGTGGHSAALRNAAARAAEEAGARVEQLDLTTISLPIFRADNKYAEEFPIIEEIRARSAAADAFLLVTPEYHGSMSGGMKNFLDFHYSEFAGKLFGLIASTGNSLGHSCLSHMRASVLYCHGWTLPYHVASRYADFNDAGEIVDPGVRDRLMRIGRDVVVYGKLLKSQFDRDVASDGPGFAGWHAVR